MDSDQFLTFVVAVLGSTLASTVLSHMWSDWRQRRQRKTSAKYAALYLAQNLESYAQRCIDWLATEISSPTPRPRSLPPHEGFPAAVVWHDLDVGIMERAFSFVTELELRGRRLAGRESEDDNYYPDAIFDEDYEVSITIASMGLKAWSIAAGIRRKHHIASIPKSDALWDIPGHLQDAKDVLEEQRRRDEQRVTPSLPPAP